jgi:hypothetical protein
LAALEELNRQAAKFAKKKKPPSPRRKAVHGGRNCHERTYRGYAATKPHAEREEHFADAAAIVVISLREMF